jgi:hypothetical protein
MGKRGKRVHRKFYYSHFSVIDSAARKLLSRLEAAIGIEPMNKGFAEIFSYHSQKDTEDQVGARTTR